MKNNCIQELIEIRINVHGILSIMEEESPAVYSALREEKKYRPYHVLDSIWAAIYNIQNSIDAIFDGEPDLPLVSHRVLSEREHESLS